MKKLLINLSSLILCTLLLISVLPVGVNASPTHTMIPEFSEAEDGRLLVSLYLPDPHKLTSIDFSLKLDSEITEIEALSTENTDVADKLYDFDSIPESTDGSGFFTYTVTKTEKSIKFSGFFLDSYSADGSFHLCDIAIIKNGELTENDILEFTYTLTCEDCSKTESHIYSLLKKDISTSGTIRSFPAGDSDLDGKINASDARRILRASVGLDSLTLEETPYADSDYDGKISASDARYALRASVGLEKTVMHSFDISLSDGEKCEDGGNYTFSCTITGKSFNMTIANGGHLCHDTDCFNTGKCEICNEEIHPATGHKFDENGICTVCSADKARLDTATEKLIPLLEEIGNLDSLADEALSADKRIDFISYTQSATKSIRNASLICNDITGLERVEEHLITAYKIRFQAFVSLMDDNGEILSSTANCDALLEAVKESNPHIDYASYMFT